MNTDEALKIPKMMEKFIFYPVKLPYASDSAIAIFWFIITIKYFMLKYLIRWDVVLILNLFQNNNRNA